MVQPVNHDFGSEAATTVLGGLKGGLFYGTLGTVASTVIGAAVGAALLGGAAFIAAPIAGPIAVGVGAVVDTVLNVVTLGIPYLTGNTINLMPDTIAQATSAATTIGGLAGGLGGLTYGGATSFIGGGIAGIFEGRAKVAREQGLASAIEQQKSQAQGQVIAEARSQAAEQYSAMGYMQGLQDGQAAIMNQLASQQQMQAAPAPEQDCAPCKVAKKIIAEHETKDCKSHVEKITASAAGPNTGLAV